MSKLLIGVALILIVSYGVVSYISKRQELKRKLTVVRQERDRIAGQLAHMQAECEFLKVYQEGELAHLANELMDRMRTLEDVFSETVDEHDRLGARIVGGLDQQVRLARVTESFSKVNQEILQLQHKLTILHEKLEVTRHAIEPLRQSFEETKKTIETLLGEECPSEWKNQLQRLSSELTKIALGDGPDSTDTAVSNCSEQISQWLERASGLAKWNEWKSTYQERSATLSACVNRLRSVGAENTHICEMVEQILSRAGEVIAEHPAQFTQNGTLAAVQQLSQELPSVLSEAMQLLSIINHPETRQHVLEQCAKEARQVLETLLLPAFSEKEQLLNRQLMTIGQIQKQEKLTFMEHLQQIIVKLPQFSTQPFVDTLQDIDGLLYLPAKLHQYIQQVEQSYLICSHGAEALQARLAALSGQVSQGMARLAEAGLSDSDEYRKLSQWREDIHLHEGMQEVETTWIVRYEHRIAEESVLLDATIRGHQSLDSSLQNHLEHLSRKGKFQGGGHVAESPTRALRTSQGDLLGAVFATLMVGEMFNNDGYDNEFGGW